VYAAPVENSAHGTLVTKELRDFEVEGLRIKFKKGRIISFEAEKGETSFRKLLEKATGDKDRNFQASLLVFAEKL
jgi:leucyl aminopeptidase (aminopeptidase T)